MRFIYLILCLTTSQLLFARPLLNGTFLYFGSPAHEELPVSKIPLFLDELSEIGMNIIVIEALKHQLKGCRGREYSWVKGLPGKLDNLLDEAQKRNFKVYMGLVSTMHSCPEFYLPENSSKTITETEKLVKELRPLFNKYHALTGWYLPDEPGHLEDRYHTYYQGLVNVIRKYSELPVMVSPYLKDIAAKKISPEELGKRARLFKTSTGVNIQAWQDSVGADGVLYKGPYIKTLSQYLGTSDFWTTIELFNWGKDLFDGGGYGATSFSRLSIQLKQSDSRFSKTRISWLGQKHLRDPALYNSFKKVSLKPLSYEHHAIPSSLYPDKKYELINNKTASPLDYQDSEWVGVLGTADISFDLGSKREIEWLRVHLLHRSAEGISFPGQMEIYCDGHFLLSEKRPVSLSDSEYVFSNKKALRRACQKIRIKLPNEKWTFLSEVEFL